MNLEIRYYRLSVGVARASRGSQKLLRAHHHAGAVYLGGRAVEAMLRAIIWMRDLDVRRGAKSLDTGHDLRQLLSLVANLGLLVAKNRDELFKERVNRVGSMWQNDLRFASTEYLVWWWQKIGKVSTHRSVKFVADEFFGDCSAIIARGEELCRS